MRSFNDWELDAIQKFIGLTSNNKISPLEKDKLIWKGDDSGSFTVKGYFNQLEEGSPCKVPYKMLWNSFIPSIVVFFCLGGVVGQGSPLNSVEEKRFPFS